MISWSHSAMNQYDTCPKQYADERVYKKIPRSENEASIYGNRGHLDLEYRLREGRPLSDEFARHEGICQMLEALPGHLFVEHEMALTRDYRPCPWESERMWVRGIADVLVVKHDKALVWDWKFGKVKPDSLQLQLFALFVFAHFPQVEMVTTIFEWLKFGERTTEIYRRPQVAELWLPFEKKYARLEESFVSGVFTPRPSGLCKKHCNNTFCQYHGRGRW